MLLRNRIKFPYFKKSARKSTYISPVPARCNTRQLPLEIQEIICFMVLGEDASNPFALTVMKVCKTWARFICERMYRYIFVNFRIKAQLFLLMLNQLIFFLIRQYQFKSYLQFVGFINTISSPDSLLPYGLFVRHIDLSPVNKYGVDARVRKFIKNCPNVTSLSFGQITSVKAETFQLLGRCCKNVRDLEIGGIQSFPFMFDCDFSGMISLRSLTLTTTPLQSASLHTLPVSIRHLNLVQMDALQYDELSAFLQQQPHLWSLSIRRCKHIKSKFSKLVEKLPELNELGLYGLEVNDDALKGLFDLPVTINTIKLCHTQISNCTLEAITNGKLVIHHLDISNNANLTKSGLESLLRKKKFKTVTL